MKKIFFITLTAFLLAPGARGQEQAPAGFSPSSLYTLSWSISTTVGSLKTFINETSPAGGSFTGRYFLKNGLAVGFEFCWNNYYRKNPRNTYYGSDGLAITAPYYSYAFVIPWKAGVYYYFMPTAIATPYMGLSLGGDYMEEHIILQEYDIYNTQWGFTMSPELGALVKFGKFSRWGATVSVQYWFNTNSFSFTGLSTYNIMQGFNYSLGLTYMLR